MPQFDPHGSAKYGRVDSKGVTEIALCRAYFAYYRRGGPLSLAERGTLRDMAEVARHNADQRIKNYPEDFLYGLGWRAPLYLLTMHYLKR